MKTLRRLSPRGQKTAQAVVWKILAVAVAATWSRAGLLLLTSLSCNDGDPAWRSNGALAISTPRTDMAAPPLPAAGDAGDAVSRCTPWPPTTTANPPNGGPMNAQTTLVHEITVRNNDLGPCDPRSFLLTVGAVPPSVSVFVQPALVSVPPGLAGRFLLAVTVDTNGSPGDYPIPFQIRDAALNEQVNGMVTYNLRPPSSCLVRPDRELLVRDVSVVDDPIRTTFDVAQDDPRRGAWTFGHLARQLAFTEDEAPAVTEQLFETWLLPRSVNGFSVAARPGIKPFLLDPWPKRSDGSLDLDRAPFRLLAIVNRIDLRNVAKGNAGEARFIFNVIAPNGGPSLFNLILEYALPATSPIEVMNWARRWHELGTLPFPSEEYNARLQQLTDQIVARGVHGNALASLRTNDFSLTRVWELRQFGVGPDGLLHEEPVTLTPDTGFQEGSQVLADFVNLNEKDIRRGAFEVPLGFRNVPFRGGSSINLLQAWNSPAIRSLDARQVFSINTCNGCHSSPETGTNFLQVVPRMRGTAAFLSGFLQGIAIIDPFSLQVRTFNDLGRRKTDLERLVCDRDMRSVSERIYRVH